jgi:hypothetical protein
VREKEFVSMRRWYVPLTVLGVASLAALCLTQRGRQALRWLAHNFENAPDTLLPWNETTLRELDRLQMALDQLADSLGTAH